MEIFNLKFHTDLKIKTPVKHQLPGEETGVIEACLKKKKVGIIVELKMSLCSARNLIHFLKMSYVFEKYDRVDNPWRNRHVS